MINCYDCGFWYDGWIEDTVWFGDMHVDWTPPVLADDVTGEPFKFVMGSELTTHVEGLLTELDGQGDVYTHEGQTGNVNFLMSYYEYMVGQYAEDNIVYGVLVAKDGFQGSDNDPGQFLSRQLAIDTVDCNDNLSCSDYFVNDLFFLDAGEPAADEWADDQESWDDWPNFGCQRVPADGYADGEYSVWILGIPLEYYATYKKIKVRIKDDVDNWRRFEVYDYEDMETELWIDPPEDDEDFCPGEAVDFVANISPLPLEPLLPYVEWLPVYEDGSERLPYDEQTNPTGYKSEILSSGPPWIGKEFKIRISDENFWAMAYLTACGDVHFDIKHVTDPCPVLFNQLNLDVFPPEQSVFGDFGHNLYADVYTEHSVDAGFTCAVCGVDTSNPFSDDDRLRVGTPGGLDCSFNSFNFKANIEGCCQPDQIEEFHIVVFKYGSPEPYWTYQILFPNHCQQFETDWSLEYNPNPAILGSDLGHYWAIAGITICSVTIYSSKVDLEVFLFKPGELYRAAHNYDGDGYFHGGLRTEGRNYGGTWFGDYWGTSPFSAKWQHGKSCHAKKAGLGDHFNDRFYYGSIDCRGLVVMALRKLCIYKRAFPNVPAYEWNALGIKNIFMQDDPTTIENLEKGDLWFTSNFSHVGIFVKSDGEGFLSFEASGGGKTTFNPSTGEFKWGPSDQVKEYPRSVGTKVFYKWDYDKIYSMIRGG